MQKSLSHTVVRSWHSMSHACQDVASWPGSLPRRFRSIPGASPCAQGRGQEQTNSGGALANDHLIIGPGHARYIPPDSPVSTFIGPGQGASPVGEHRSQTAFPVPKVAIHSEMSHVALIFLVFWAFTWSP